MSIGWPLSPAPDPAPPPPPITQPRDHASAISVRSQYALSMVPSQSAVRQVGQVPVPVPAFACRCHLATHAEQNLCQPVPAPQSRCTSCNKNEGMRHEGREWGTRNGGRGMRE
jgi:hypothetical protein